MESESRVGRVGEAVLLGWRRGRRMDGMDLAGVAHPLAIAAASERAVE